MSGRAKRDLLALWPWSLCALAAAVSLVLVEQLRPPDHTSDFASYYFAGVEAARGHDIYRAYVTHRVFPYLYPPFLAVAIRPLTWFSLGTAVAVWNALQILLAAGTLWLTNRILHRLSLPATWPVVAAAMLCSWVFLLNLLWAQVNVAITFLALLAVWLMLTSRALLAGVVVGVAVSIKVTPIGVMLVAMLMRPRDIAITVAACVASVVACCFVVPALAVDFSWAQEMNQHFLHFSWQSAMGVASALPFGNNDHNQSLTFRLGPWALALPILAAATVAWVTWRRSQAAELQPIVIAQAFVVTPLIAPIAWDHHWFALLPALAIMIALRRRSPYFLVSALALALAIIATLLIDDLPLVFVPLLVLCAGLSLATAAIARWPQRTARK